MSLRILVVPDKYKGTLTAAGAAKAIASGWRQARPQDTLKLLPMTDGGDGFGEVMSALLQAKPQTLATIDAAHRHARALWWWMPERKTAIVESANIIGLAKPSPGKFHPFELDSFGLGAAILAAARKGARHCLVGIGGSATNDGGFGLARSLGWTFLDRAGTVLNQWIQLHDLAEIRPPRKTRWFPSLTVAVDVQNRLLGPRGCTRVYGPQKGLQPQDFALAERCLQRLAAVVQRQMRHDFAALPGAGAAGGLGFGLSCFAGAHLQPGFQLFAHHARLSAQMQDVDLVVTGEGAIDDQTLMGKGTGQIGQWCHKRKIPCLGLAGTVPAGARINQCFAQVHALTDLTTLEEAKRRPSFWLRRLGARVAREISEYGLD